jgi:hypothetical protein
LGCILPYVGDLKQRRNADIGRKDFFAIASSSGHGVLQRAGIENQDADIVLREIADFFASTSFHALLFKDSCNSCDRQLNPARSLYSPFHPYVDWAKKADAVPTFFLVNIRTMTTDDPEVNELITP